MRDNKKFLEIVTRYEKALKSVQSKEVVVGIPASKNKSHKKSKGLTVAAIGFQHEFGVPERGIPQRSFLRDPLSRYSGEVIDQLRKKLSIKDMSPQKALQQAGVQGVAIVLEAFKTENNGQWKKLSQKTIDAKESAKPLIDTGQLRSSITYEVRNAK